MTTRWRGIRVLAVTMLAGCVLPLDVEIDGHHHDTDSVRGSGHVVSQVRAVSGYDAILASGVGRVVIRSTGRETLRITAEDNIVPYLRTEVEGGTLVIGPRPGVSLEPRHEIVFEIGVVELSRIEGSGAVSFEAELGRQPEMAVVLSGVCVIEATGSVDRLNVWLSGVTGFGGLHMQSRLARVDVSGVSWAVVWATERLDAWASGVSSVRYTGSAAVYAHASGSSWVGPYQGG